MVCGVSAVGPTTALPCGSVSMTFSFLKESDRGVSDSRLVFELSCSSVSRPDSEGAGVHDEAFGFVQRCDGDAGTGASRTEDRCFCAAVPRQMQVLAVSRVIH